MADEVVIVTDESPPDEPEVIEPIVEATIAQEGRLAALEQRCESFVTRDDLAVVAASINNVGETAAAASGDVAELREEIAVAEIEEVAEEIAEEPEPQPEPEPEKEAEEEPKDEPPSSKRPHRWWRSHGE